jgi:hypothetical protein
MRFLDLIVGYFEWNLYNFHGPVFVRMAEGRGTQARPQLPRDYSFTLKLFYFYINI